LHDSPEWRFSALLWPFLLVAAHFALLHFALQRWEYTVSSAFQDELQTATRAVREAVKLCRAVQTSSSTLSRDKQDRSPVTVADFGAQALICRAIRSRFPDDPIIAEEDSQTLRADAALLERTTQHVGDILPGASSADVCDWLDAGGHENYADRFWTLDPIDGTKGFLRQEHYAVALALVIDGQVAAAALACPKLSLPEASGREGIVLTAIRGRGCRADWIDAPPNSSSSVAAATTATTHGQDARFCESVESGHSAHSVSAQIAQELGISRPPVRLDSQAKYAAVALGMADIYLRLPTRADYREKIWDHAAGLLTVEEAGGAVTDIHGQPLDFTQGRELSKNRGVIVSNGPLHHDLLAAVAKTLQTD